MKYLKQYGVENLKPGDIIIVDNIISVFLDYCLPNKNSNNYILRYVYLVSPYALLPYTEDDGTYHQSKHSVYEHHFKHILKIENECAPQDIIEFRDKLMNLEKIQKKLLKWSLGK